MDAKNTPVQHAIVGILSLALVSIFVFLLQISWSVAFARVSFILLFLVLIIGPITRLKKPITHSPYLRVPITWRGEIGIWFFLTALTHFIIVLIGSPLSDLIKMGGGGFSLTNLLGLIALFLGLLLTATSFGKVIVFLGVESWKWLHHLAYVIFYLVSAHLVYFQFFSTYGEIGPDWFGYLAVAMAVLVIILQLTAFVLGIKKHRNEVCPIN